VVMIDFPWPRRGYCQAFPIDQSGDLGGKPLAGSQAGTRSADQTSTPGSTATGCVSGGSYGCYMIIGSRPSARSVSSAWSRTDCILRNRKHVLLSTRIVVSRVGRTAVPSTRIPPATRSTILSTIRPLEDPTLVASLPLDYRVAYQHGLERLHRPAAGAAFQRLVSSPDENTGLSRPTASSVHRPSGWLNR